MSDLDKVLSRVDPRDFPEAHRTVDAICHMVLELVERVEDVHPNLTQAQVIAVVERRLRRVMETWETGS